MTDFSAYVQKIEDQREQLADEMYQKYQLRQEAMKPILDFVAALQESDCISFSDYPGDNAHVPTVFLHVISGDDSIADSCARPILVACTEAEPLTFYVMGGLRNIERKFHGSQGYEAIFDFVAKLVIEIGAEEDYRENLSPPLS